MKTSLIFVFFIGLTVTALAETPEGYPENTTFKGYAKRDRLLVGGVYSVSPAQLHEIKGLRADVGSEMSRSVVRDTTGLRKDIANPSTTARAEYGWDTMTLGLAASYLSGKNNSNGPTDEVFTSTKVIPQIATTLGKFTTIGAGYEINFLDLTEKGENDTTTFSYDIERPFIGIAYHTTDLEFGIAYNSEAQEASKTNHAQPRKKSLSLSQTEDENTRSVYLPAETVIYGRGNLTDAVSVMSSVSMSRYDGNVDGSVELFDRYHTSDRLAAKVLTTYATPMRSSVSFALEYKGGATTAIGADEAGLGYRIANTYGASLAGVLSVNRKTYVGLMAGYARGERDETSNEGTRYTSRESTNRIAGSLTLKL